MSTNILTKNKNTALFIVKQDLIDKFIKAVYSKPANQNYVSNRTLFEKVDNTWSLDLLDMVFFTVKQ